VGKEYPIGRPRIMGLRIYTVSFPGLWMVIQPNGKWEPTKIKKESMQILKFLQSKIAINMVGENI